MFTFQEIIQKLVQFWSSKGCIIHQGHDVEVGAGTFNPATFLRCLGPEPYKTVYVEPSRRPQDGRYGENPNRLQLFHQLQVIVKPSPVDIQKTYLQSLEEIGFSSNDHDIRFVHDDWESPTLGAWGLGWEIWIDGMEVSQFTYFQSIAGLELNPIPVEITYGLERLCMLAQKKNNFFEMKYNEELTYGDVFHRNEVEWSKYNFETSSPTMWLKHFEDYEKEAKNLINLNLPIPGYDFVMKASHAFNMLEARGVISTTERTNYIHRIRDLAKLSAIEYLASREKMGFPLLKKPATTCPVSLPQSTSHSFNPDHRKDFLFEIGVEQLPATFIPIGIEELKRIFNEFLNKHTLSYQDIKLFGSPQRLSILISGLAEGTACALVEKRGPQLSVAFDAAGQLTKQGSGFFESLSVPFATKEEIQNNKHPSIKIQSINDKEYLFGHVAKSGESTFKLLESFLVDAIKNISFPKSMRWADFDISFARPIQWIIALLGEEVVPVHIANVISSNLSKGHAQRHPHPVLISHPSVYESELEKAFVIADVAKRKNHIEKQLDAILQKNNCSVLKKERVLNEVLFLVEWPELAIYDFDKKFLKVPAEVLVSEMVEHQRYFPVTDKQNTLLPKFIITADTCVNKEILRNNLAVLSARLSDGVFLYEQDLALSLDYFNEKLKAITFHKDLGTVYQKVERLEKIALQLNQLLKVEDDSIVKRAAHLCKADLSSAMVGEFPELQGTIGMYYARHHKEKELVAIAIKEHWLPVAEKGDLPTTNCGRLISLADKIDNILSYYSVGIKPTSSKDPFALRRQTLGILRILLDAKWSIALDKLFENILPRKQLLEEIYSFFKIRLKTIFEEGEFEKDEIEASLSYASMNPFEEYCKIKALHEFRQSSNAFNQMIEVFKRAKGQIGNEARKELNESLLKEPAEKKLLHGLKLIDQSFIEAIHLRNYKKAFELLTTLQQPIGQLFDEVKILDQDVSIKNNRIALLQEVFHPFTQLLDLSKLQIK
ncbi:MAG: glycine--tRNA ligase subunit beta [Chlamydiales bacterium]|nr:glycine--tRNA ligase subunit beta [Chlamydiales bacterium]